MVRLALLVLLLALARHAAADSLVVATSGGQDPFAGIEGGRAAGLEAELVAALCDRLADPCRWETTDWTGLVAGLAAGRIDLGFGALSRDTVASLGLGASRTWLSLPSRYAGLGTPAPDDPLRDDGTVIGALWGSPHALWLATRLPPGRLKRFADAEEMYLSLHAGAVDLVFDDALVLWRGLLRGPLGEGAAFTGPAVDLASGGDDLVFALPSGSPRRVAVDAALADLIADGTVAALVARHLPGWAGP